MRRGPFSRRWLLMALALISLAACRRAGEPPAAPVTIALTRPLFSPVVGVGQMAVHVTDEAGQPVDGAVVAFRGDMTHAGMAPVLATAEPAGNGDYHADLDLNMAGDWVVTVSVTLPNGQQASRAFDMRVTGEDVQCEIPEE